jgi:hypothetical protein
VFPLSFLLLLGFVYGLAGTIAIVPTTGGCHHLAPKRLSQRKAAEKKAVVKERELWAKTVPLVE